MTASSGRPVRSSATARSARIVWCSGCRCTPADASLRASCGGRGGAAGRGGDGITRGGARQGRGHVRCAGLSPRRLPPPGCCAGRRGTQLCSGVRPHLVVPAIEGVVDLPELPLHRLTAADHRGRGGRCSRAALREHGSRPRPTAASAASLFGASGTGSGNRPNRGWMAWSSGWHRDDGRDDLLPGRELYFPPFQIIFMTFTSYDCR